MTHWSVKIIVTECGVTVCVYCAVRVCVSRLSLKGQHVSQFASLRVALLNTGSNNYMGQCGSYVAC